MGVYEVDLYAKTLYGAPLFVSFQSNMRAEQAGYAALEVTWESPIQASASQILAGVRQWSRLRLVRNSYGIPDAEDDGWVILDLAAGQGAGVGEPANVYLDDTVVPGQVYYYGVFVSTAPELWDTGITYYPGDLVTHEDTVYRNVSPASWEATTLAEAWVRCGGCVGMAVRDMSHSTLLYNHIPRPYKVGAVESTASSIPINDQLARFCAVFGYFFDVMKCENDQLLRMNDAQKCTDRQLYLLAQEMGIADRLPTMPELRRTYVRDAAEIQRDRGSPASTQQLVKAVTGWDAEIVVGYNDLHDVDEAAFASPAYPEWQRDRVYYTTHLSQLHSDIVTYNGEMYAAIGTPRRESAYISKTTSPVNPTSTGSGIVSRVDDRVADPYPGYVRLSSGKGGTLTYTFNAASGGAGWYNVLLVCIADPEAGIVTASVNGTQSTVGPIDLYSPTRQQIPVVNLGKFNLNSTGNTLTLTATDKNALSGGHHITICWWMIHGGGINLNVRPTGDEFSYIYWQKIPPDTLKDYLTQVNPTTGGYGSWNLYLPDGSANPEYALPAGGAAPDPSWWISPQGAKKTVTSPGDGNSLNITAKTAGNHVLFTAGGIKADMWFESNTYHPGQAVTHNPLNWERPPVYVATAQSAGRPPDLNPDKWQLTAWSTTNSTFDTSRLLRDGVMALKIPSWSATRRYDKGARIAWRGHLYEAALPSLGIFPTGYDTDNRWWRWCGLDSQRYTFSFWHDRDNTATGRDVRPYVNFFDAKGNVGGQAHAGSTAQMLFDRFETRPVYPLSTGSAPAGYVMPAVGQQGVPIPWNYSYGQWGNTRGVVRPVAWESADANLRKAGRVLWFQRDWVYNPKPTAQTGEEAYVTFMSPPDESEAVMEHGIVFRRSATAYWLASRDRLTYTTLTLSGSTVTGVTVAVVATWPPVAYGERMRVTNLTGTITVRARTTSYRTLATVSDTRNNTATGYGLLERVRS
jgi:hypothetical protein